MKMGYRLVQSMCDELEAFMQQHGFETLDDFKGHSLQFFTTHADLVRIQDDARKAARADHARKPTVATQTPEKADKEAMIRADAEWTGDDFVNQSDALARG